jgi:hypothetical protein
LSSQATRLLVQRALRNTGRIQGRKRFGFFAQCSPMCGDSNVGLFCRIIDWPRVGMVFVKVMRLESVRKEDLQARGGSSDEE